MALAFGATTVRFDSTSGIRQKQPGSVNFPSKVKLANCTIKGYRIRFSSGDRPIHEIEIDIDNVAWDGNNVAFKVDFGLRDSSGKYDDAYEGWVDVLVIADVQ